MSGGEAGPQPWVNELTGGALVGEYRVDERIGEGGMGRVYSATHPVIAKRVAIKVLHAELSANRELVERFIQEARSVNQIGHPNIVDIFSFGTLPNGSCYFVMELLRGESMRDRLRRGPLGLDEALPILETVVAALEAAHENGIVHRDLKPDNIFLVDVKAAAPQVKLLDFGIAKLLSNDTLAVERTRTGNLMGTPAYMSPEQARGQMVDHRTDIYSLGCVAYEMFSGSLVFPADNAADMIAQQLMAPPPSLLRGNPRTPPELDALVRAMLAKHPGERPSLEQVREALRRVAAGRSATLPGDCRQDSVSSPPPAPRSRRRAEIVVSLLAVAGLVVAIAVGVRKTVFSGDTDTPATAPSTAEAATAPATAPTPAPLAAQAPAAQAPAEPAPAAQVPAEPAATSNRSTAEPAKPRKKPVRKRPTSAGPKTSQPPPAVVDEDAPL